MAVPFAFVMRCGLTQAKCAGMGACLCCVCSAKLFVAPVPYLSTATLYGALLLCCTAAVLCAVDQRQDWLWSRSAPHMRAGIYSLAVDPMQQHAFATGGADPFGEARLAGACRVALGPDGLGRGALELASRAKHDHLIYR